MSQVSKAKTIDEYLAAFAPETRSVLQQIRLAVATAAPDATEAISYGIPTFKLGGKNLVHFAAFAHHVGFYATPDGHTQFETELSQYKQGKGSVQFPLDKPMPLDLISRIVIYRVAHIQS